MKKIYTLCLGIFITITANAQPTIEWQKTIGGNLNDLLFSIHETFDGGYILGGWSNSNISGDKSENCQGEFDYWVVKTNSLGDIQWQNTLGGSDIDVLFSIQQTMDGGYILGGFSNSNISGDKTEDSKGDYDYWIIKIDTIGDIQWQKTIGGSDDERLYSLMQTTDGGYILGGTSSSDISGDKTENSNGLNDYWIVKTDASGNILWQNTIGGISDDYLLYIKAVDGGGYILGGYSISNISGDKSEDCKGGWDYWIVRTSDTGNIVWQKTIGGSADDLLITVEQTIDGGYILGGFSNSNISGDKTEDGFGWQDYWIIKTDSSGAIQWQKTIGGNGPDELYSIQSTIEGGYILGGWSNSNISGNKTENSKGGDDYWIVRTDAIGNIQWQKTIGGSNNEKIYSMVCQTIDGGFILGGYSESNISGDKNENSYGMNDYWLVKLSGVISVNDNNFSAVFSVFPNPSIGEVNVSFTLKEEKEIKIELFNTLGQVVKTITQQKFAAGKNQINFSTEKFSKGIYHVKFSVDENVVTRKLVKM